MRLQQRDPFSLLALALLLAICTLQVAAQKPGHGGYRLVGPEVGPSTLEGSEGEALRPGYHITAPYGWMNDPNGPMEHMNLTHVFFQWNPMGPVWGAPYWGHVVSSDLVFWKRLPPALVPDTAYDLDGVFSGSAASALDGSPLLLYTGSPSCLGVSRKAELGYYFQQQAAAVPVNASDPELARWLKPASNPLAFQLPPGGTPAQFRDPITPLEQGGRFWTAIGGQVDCIGSAILYSSEDLQAWQLEGELASQVSLGQTNGECPAPASPTAGEPACDQMGAQCRTWECPDFFELEGAGVWVLKWSDQVNDRDPFARDWYVATTIEPELAAATANASLAGAFADSVLGYEPQVIDYGSIYASKSWRAADGRRLWLGWVFETAAGCVQQCSAGTPFTQSLGWQGAQTIPREVTWDAAASALLLNPVAEVALLRGSQLYAQDGVDLTGHNTSETALVIAQGASLVQSQLLANFSLAADGPFEVGAVLRFGNDSEAAVFVNGTATNGSASVFVDRSRAGGNTNTSAEGGPIPLPPDGIPASSLQLQLLTDRSLLEVFALGGRGRVASRVYPAGMLEPDWQLALYGRSGGGSGGAGVSAAAWELSGCWVSDVMGSGAADARR